METDKMRGPWRSPWSTGDWYLVTDLRYSQVVWVAVQNGCQRDEFPAHATRRDAIAWLKDNGYQPINITKGELK